MNKKHIAETQRLDDITDEAVTVTVTAVFHVTKDSDMDRISAAFEAALDELEHGEDDVAFVHYDLPPQSITTDRVPARRVSRSRS